MAKLTYAEAVAKYGLLDEYNRIEQQVEQAKQAYDAALTAFLETPSERKPATVDDPVDALEAAHKLATKEQGKFSRRFYWMVKSCENLKEALLETGIAEVSYNDGYIATVKDEMGEFGDKYLLTIQQGAMPPHFSKELDMPEQVIVEIPVSYDWEALKWKPVEAE